MATSWIEELPPRARRIQPVLPKNWFVQGTTSACAENTGLDHLANSIDRNYLRVRGEYPKQCHKERLIRELPPRARRIRFGLSSRSVAHGTTSACAENTRFSSTALPTVRNYLRVRGEYERISRYTATGLELPPRARRIRLPRIILFSSTGTTSACAENTDQLLPMIEHGRNYLRVRGEYLSATVPAEAFDELPPRARRILGPGRGRRRTLGTTSACAENTPGAASRSCAIWNYLRVRGEYPFDWAIGRTPWELPPRARRIQYELDVAELRNGTTSACAENTLHYHSCFSF